MKSTRIFASALAAAVVAGALSSCAIADMVRDTADNVRDLIRNASGVGEIADFTPADEPIYVTNVSAGTLLDYFADVAFGSEYGESENVVCKWTHRIKYRLEGDYTEEDRDLLRRVCERLNEIDGFPGISETSLSGADLTVSFVPRQTIIDSFANANENCSGMAEYEWNGETGEIVSARAAIDRDLTSERACTVCEEFLQALGPARDSYMFPNSVFYEGYTLMPFPAEIDFAVMAILYSRSIPTGVTKTEALSRAVRLLRWE